MKTLKSKLNIVIVSAFMLFMATIVGGCGNVTKPLDKYYTMTQGRGNYLTFQRHATNCMVAYYDWCRDHGYSKRTSGKMVLRMAKDKIEPQLGFIEWTVWHGSPGDPVSQALALGNAFNDTEANDLVTAIEDMRSRGHQCLRIHYPRVWDPANVFNWTTLDASHWECDWGAVLN